MSGNVLSIEQTTLISTLWMLQMFAMHNIPVIFLLVVCRYLMSPPSQLVYHTNFLTDSTWAHVGRHKSKRVVQAFIAWTLWYTIHIDVCSCYFTCMSLYVQYVYVMYDTCPVVFFSFPLQHLLCMCTYIMLLHIFSYFLFPLPLSLFPSFSFSPSFFRSGSD